MAKVKSQYQVKDILIFDTNFINSCFSNKITPKDIFKSLNNQRVILKNKVKYKHIKTIKSNKDFFEVFSTYYNGNIQYVSVFPIQDKLSIQNIIDFAKQNIHKAFVIDLPSFMFAPQDNSNLELMSRYLSLTRCCPWCNDMVKIYYFKNKSELIAYCKKSNHTYKSIRFSNGKHSHTLKVDNILCEYDINNKIMLNGVRKDNNHNLPIFEKMCKKISSLKAFF